MRPLGSCGETDEMAAARGHMIVAVLSTVACAAALGTALVEAVMAVWHWRSVGVHRRRARDGAGW